MEADCGQDYLRPSESHAVHQVLDEARVEERPQRVYGLRHSVGRGAFLPEVRVECRVSHGFHHPEANTWTRNKEES